MGCRSSRVIAIPSLRTTRYANSPRTTMTVDPGLTQRDVYVLEAPDGSSATFFAFFHAHEFEALKRKSDDHVLQHFLQSVKESWCAMSTPSGSMSPSRSMSDLEEADL